MRDRVRLKLMLLILVLVVVVSVGIYPLVASYYGITSPSWLMQKQLKLGLDLKGGVHLVLRVQTDEVLRSETEQEMERLLEVLRKQNILAANITMPSLTQFRVEGVSPTQDAAFRNASAVALNNFDRSPGTSGTYTFTMKPSVQIALRSQSVVQARQTIERRVNELGVTEPSIAQQGPNGDQILVQLPGVTDVEHAKAIMGSPGVLELKWPGAARPGDSARRCGHLGGRRDLLQSAQVGRGHWRRPAQCASVAG